MIRKQTIVMLGAMFLSACGPSPWERAQKTDTIEAYETFIAQHANSEFAAAAKKRVEELSWVAANGKQAVDGYEAFLKAYPDSPHAAEARATLSELRWTSAVSTNTIVAYVDYARVANAKDQTARAREAVRSLASDAPKPKAGEVQVRGVFADNMIKFVDSIDVAYVGTIAGYAAKIRYTVQVAKNAQGQQLYFIFNDRGEALEMSSPATVTGTIELMVQDSPVKFDLSRIALGPQPNFAGSFLVARHPPMLWSDVAGLELLDAKHDAATEKLAAGEAVLFEVQPDYSVMYVP